MVVIGGDASHTPVVRGSVVLVVRTPEGVEVKSVKYVVDGDEIGHSVTRPFRLSWNSTTKPDQK
jgi:hypothetical protein